MWHRQDTGSVTKTQKGESRSSWRIIAIILVSRSEGRRSHTLSILPSTSCSLFLSRLIIFDAMSFSSACYRLRRGNRQDYARILERSAGTDSFPSDDDHDADLNTSFPLPMSPMSAPCVTRTTDCDPNQLPTSAEKESAADRL